MIADQIFAPEILLTYIEAYAIDILKSKAIIVHFDI